VRKRVVLVAHGIHDHGGMERAFAELVRRIHGRYDVVVLSTDLGENLRRLVEWRRIPAPARPAALRFAVFYVIAAVRLATTRADIVHTLGAIVPNAGDVASVHFCTAGFLGRFGRLAPPDAPVLRRLNTAAARMLLLAAERWTYRPGRTACLAAVSGGVARELERSFPRMPTILAPNGVDRSRFRPDPRARDAVRHELGIADEAPVALFVGGDWDGKGLGLAIRAVARAEMQLLVLGHGDERRFGALAAEVGADVRFLGQRPDTERYYAASDAFVLPSWYETFSLAAFEAAASGLPIVAAPVHGVEELVGNNEAGLLVEREVDAIAGALTALAASPDLRKRLGASARERTADYTWERSAEAVLTAYRAALDAKAAPGVLEAAA
jgi:glycosyltransferase involved in cell wall biosynthesis